MEEIDLTLELALGYLIRKEGFEMNGHSIWKLVGVTAVLVVIVLVGTTLLPVSGKDVRLKNEVIMLRCDPRASGFAVTAYSHSQAAPARRVDNCPETLSTLNRDGFHVLDIARFDVDGGYLVYTLVR
jgi:hypothetical protein